MSSPIGRRSFLKTGLAAGAVAALPAGTERAVQATAQAPAIRKGGPRPVVIASANGHRFRNGGQLTGIALACERRQKVAAGRDTPVYGRMKADSGRRPRRRRPVFSRVAFS